jgi:mRNA interferase MazF
VIQADSFNRSRIQTVLVAVITTNQELAEAPGNVLVSKSVAGLPRDSVVNVSQVMTLDRRYLTEPAGKLPMRVQTVVDTGLRLALDL